MLGKRRRRWPNIKSALDECGEGEVRPGRGGGAGLRVNVIYHQVVNSIRSLPSAMMDRSETDMSPTQPYIQPNLTHSTPQPPLNQRQSMQTI